MKCTTCCRRLRVLCSEKRGETGKNDSSAIIRPCWLLLAFLLMGIAERATAATHTVTVIGAFPNYAYSPKTLSIQQGDKVIWNSLAGIHSVTGDTPPETMCGGTFPANCTNVFNTPGSFRYHCINHVNFGMTGLVTVAAVVLPPSVSITNPAAAAVFAAPAGIKIQAAANTTTGTITNVQFFTNGTSAGTVTSGAFTFTTAPLNSGAYSLTAKATATTGLSATSAPVNITVVAPVAISNYFGRVESNQFIFRHTANPGLEYVVQGSTNLKTWSPVITNMATSNSVEVKDTFRVGDMLFYRVNLQPNP